MSSDSAVEIDDFEEPDDDRTDDKPPGWVHVLCGWPLVMVAFGGAIGGGLGGLAYGLSITAYRQTKSLALTIACSLMLGAGAVGTWYWIVSRVAQNAG